MDREPRIDAKLAAPACHGFNLPEILVIGATGAIGQFLVPRLLEAGDRVIGLSRQPPAAASPLQIEWLRGDLFADMPTLPAIDVVYSLGPLDAFAAWVARSGLANVARIIAFSSMSAQSKQTSQDPAERALAQRLQTAEAQLFEAARWLGSACTVFRPTLIYGTGRDRSLAPMARFAQRWRVLPIPRGASGLRQPVHAADLAEACLRARDCTAAHGQTYALGGGERLRFDLLLRRIASGLPRKALPIPVPLAFVRAGARLARGHALDGALARLTTSLIAENGPAERDFGYAPRRFREQDVAGVASASHS
jgi:nucleoside-diphosphate-sugar epimerase